MNAVVCRTQRELSDYVYGRLEGEMIELVEEHVEQCSDCQATVVMLAEQSDTFVNQLRQRPLEDPFEQEAACQRGLARLTDGQPDLTSWHPTDETQQIGPYQIIEPLGTGGMGTVFKAFHTKLKRIVALKILPGSRWADASAIARFEREMEVIGQLDHPHIVRASDAGEEHGMHYLVMEHVDGLDLSRLVNRLGPLPVADACEVARQAAVGMQYAHENHLVHRDIKPSNLMLASGGTSGQPATVKILDLGLALLGEEHAGRDNELTTVGQLMGTLDYMSPEQGMDSHDVDIRADIYSLGATLYKLLTGRAPFAGPQYNTLLKKVTALCNKPVPPARTLRPEIPDELASIIDRMLMREPSQRFATPAEVATALAPFTHTASLRSLLTRALQQPESCGYEPTPAPARFSSQVAPSVASLQGKTHRSAYRWPMVTALVALGLLGLAIAATIVIRIATDRGELVVRAEDPNAEVVIRRDGRPVKELQLRQGDNTIQVRSGEYQIELQGRGDELSVSRDSVTIKRGESVIVHVQQRPKAPAGDMMEDMYSAGMMSDDPGATTEMEEGMYGGDMSSYGGMSGMGMGFAMGPSRSTKPVPTYDGRTYRQWLAELETERMPERLSAAILAFAALGEGDEELAEESTAAILRVMRRNGSRVIDHSPRGNLINQAMQVLRQMPAKVVVEAMAQELKQGTTRSRMFINSYLSFPYLAVAPQGDAASSEVLAALEAEEDRLNYHLINLPSDELAVVRADALALVIGRAKTQGRELDEIDGLLPALRNALGEKDLSLLSVASDTLADADPDHKLLVPALIRVVASPDYNQRVRAVESLGKLGPRAAPAVSALVKIIEPLAAASTAGGGGEYGYGGNEAMGGMPGAGFGGYDGSMYGGSMYGGGGLGGGYGMGGGFGAGNDIYRLTIQTLGEIGPAARKALPVLRKVASAGSSEVATPDAAPYAQDAKLAIEKIES